MTKELTRAALRKALNDNGVPTGRAEDGEVATIVDFVGVWGVMAGVTANSQSDAITAALDKAKIVWTVGNMVQVDKRYWKSRSGFHVVVNDGEFDIPMLWSPIEGDEPTDAERREAERRAQTYRDINADRDVTVSVEWVLR